MRAEFAKMSFIPNDDVRCTNFVESRPAGEKGVDDGWEVFEVLKDEFGLRNFHCSAERKGNLKRMNEHTTDVGGGDGGWGRRPLPMRELFGRSLL